MRRGQLSSRSGAQIHLLTQAAGLWVLTSWLTWSSALKAKLAGPEEEDTKVQPESTHPGANGLHLGNGASLLRWEGKSVGAEKNARERSFSPPPPPGAQHSGGRQRNRTPHAPAVWLSEAPGTRPLPSLTSEPTSAFSAFILPLKPETASRHPPSSPGRLLLVRSPAQAQSCGPAVSTGSGGPATEVQQVAFGKSLLL